MPRFTNIILALGLLMIPAQTFAINIWTFPFGISVGGGSDMFSAGIDWMFPTANPLIYKSPKDNKEHKMPTNELWWTVRSRYIYDYNEHQAGVFLQPNIHYLLKVILFNLALGPEIGWKTETGFDYGASARTGLMGCAHVEFGHLFNSTKTYVNFLFNLPFGPMLGWKVIEKKYRGNNGEH